MRALETPLLGCPETSEIKLPGNDRAVVPLVVKCNSLFTH